MNISTRALLASRRFDEYYWYPVLKRLCKVGRCAVNVNFFCIHSSYTVLLPCGGFQFSLDLYTIGRTPWTSDRPIARPLPKYRTTQTEKRTRPHMHTHQTSMPYVGFESTITASERAKTVHAPERSATVPGKCELSSSKYRDPSDRPKTTKLLLPRKRLRLSSSNLCRPVSNTKLRVMSYRI
jgi:hypothetical protein